MKNIFKALADFQQEVPVIHKGTEGFGYSYTDLPAIFEVINPLLKKHGLGFTQLVNENSLKTILFHIESCETIESTTSLIDGVKLAKMNDFQVLGSQITYLRRYAISAMLGIVTDKDIDAQGTQEPKEQKKTELKPVPADQLEKAKQAIEAGTITKDQAIEKLKKAFNLTEENIKAL